MALLKIRNQELEKKKQEFHQVGKRITVKSIDKLNCEIRRLMKEKVLYFFVG